MKSYTPERLRILLRILVIALIGVVILIIIGTTSQGGSTGQLADQPGATLTDCTVRVLYPEYSPENFYPPISVIYGSRPFLVNWTLTNTSENCVWSTLQLLTVVNGELKMLKMMPSSRDLPVINEEFAIWDRNHLPVNQVNPYQSVTISIQISGLDLISSNGNIDRSFRLIVNGQPLAGGNLIAQLSPWVEVRLPIAMQTISLTPSETSTITFTPTITVSPTGTPTITASPTRTPKFIFLPTQTATAVVLPPPQPTSIPPQPTPTTQPATPTLAPPPIDTPPLPNP